jgi:hypothetical protein
VISMVKVKTTNVKEKCVQNHLIADKDKIFPTFTINKNKNSLAGLLRNFK